MNQAPHSNAADTHAVPARSMGSAECRQSQAWKSKNAEGRHSEAPRRELEGLLSNKVEPTQS
jgi:hypothetical protein